LVFTSFPIFGKTAEYFKITSWLQIYKKKLILNKIDFIFCNEGEILNFDFILWPMLLPMLLPLFYCVRYKKESFVEVGIIFLAMTLIVIFYWPLTTCFVTTANIFIKFLLFIFLPILLLLILKRDKSILYPSIYGIKKEGLKKSVFFGLFFIHIMLIVTFLVKYFNGVVTETNIVLGIISFIESFSEEFLFRGILFLLMLNRTNLKIAYITSFTSFILMHPQHFTDIFIISTIVQGILTIEICHRSENLTGAWLIHGSNRFFNIAILPFII
jgi:hypothetical protein